MDTEDSLRLALEAEKHCHRKDNEYLIGLLGRALAAFVPNHDAAQELSVQLGLGPLPNSDLIDEIRALTKSNQQPSGTLKPEA